MNDRIKRLEDGIAKTIRSWTFIISQAVFIALWIVINKFPSLAFDDAYYNILRLIITVESSFVGSILLMAQHRQSEIDRKIVQEDFELDKMMAVDIKKIKKRTKKRKPKPKPRIKTKNENSI